MTENFPSDSDPNAKVYKVPISGFSSTNQEQDRIAREIEAVFNELPEEVANTWVNAKAIMFSINEDLGYEDEDELEDALGMSFLEFCEQMGNLEIGEVDSVHVDGKKQATLRLKKVTPKSEWKKIVLTIKVHNKEDLWQVLYLSPQASWEIPEIGFEVVADGNKKVHNPLYNHMASAMQNLELFCVGKTEEQKAMISQQMDTLQKCLDLDMPFTVVVTDPAGLSQFENPSVATRKEFPSANTDEVKESSSLEVLEEKDPDDCDNQDLADFPAVGSK